MLDITGSVLDYSSFDFSPMLNGRNDGLPDFYNAQEIMENSEGNDVLSDLIQGFGALANTLLSELGGVTEEGKRRRELASLEPVQVTDVACPAGLTYAPQDAFCLNFKFTIDPEMQEGQFAAFSEKLKWAVDESGLLYDTIKRDHPDTLIKGLGSPGKGIEYLASEEPADPVNLASSENEATEESSGLGSAAVIFIILAVIALPVAIVAMYARYKKVQSELVVEYNGSQHSRKPVTNDIEAQQTVPATITAVPDGGEDDEDSVWSDDRNEVEAKGSKAGSSLAAMGAAGLGASLGNVSNKAPDDEVRAEVEQLIKDTNAPKTADEMLASYAGREQELLTNLRKMRAMQQTTEQKAATRAEVEALVKETNAPKSADELLNMFEGREEELIKNLTKLKEKNASDAKLAEIRAEIAILAEETGAPKSAEEMLASYAGREEELLKNLKKMKTKKQIEGDKAALRAEVEGLVKETNSPKSADELLASYAGKEDELVANLKKMKSKMSSKEVLPPAEVAVPVDEKAAIKAEITALVEANSPGYAEDMLAAYEGREEELLKNLQKMQAKQESASKSKSATEDLAVPAAPLAAQPVNVTEDSDRKSVDSDRKSIIEEIESLVEITKPGKSVKDLCAAYEGREEELVTHLKKLKSSSNASSIV